jgi:hypothetical protein
MKIKEAKASFNTLLLKVDKQARWRLCTPLAFFCRRFATAALLAMPVTYVYIFLQYVFILMTSHLQVLFLVSNKPYQAPIYNNYVLANEAFYTAIIIALFIFSDATPDLDIKTYAAIVLLSSCGLLIFVNLLMVLVVACKGKDKLKDETN